MRRLAFVALLAFGAHTAGAQSIFDGELRLAPQFMQYRIKAPANETISELAIPVFARVPFGSNFTFDVGTSYSRARVSNADGVSEVSGLTDTQLRGNLTLGSDFVVLTGGMNLPTGRSSVSLAELTAAGRIGSDFLAFPISNMGTGFGLTGGVAIARPLGEWNLGFGGAVRHSTSYEPFSIPGQSFHFQPGNEYRARVGLDHPFGYGRVTAGLTYSAFADDNAGGSVYNTGNRLIAQAAATNTYSGTDVTVAAYNVFRGEGNYASGDRAGRENIFNAFFGLGLHMLGTVIEPSLEARHWLQNVPATTPGTVLIPAHTQSSYLGTFALRTRIEIAGFSFYPSGGYTLGRLATVGASSSVTSSDMTGYRAELAVRIGQ
jgi:hypothetical protein